VWFCFDARVVQGLRLGWHGQEWVPGTGRFPHGPRATSKQEQVALLKWAGPSKPFQLF
jgi:hypothetical protein